MSTGIPKRKDVSEAPLSILKQNTKEAIAASLDSRKLLLSEQRLHRDWRGIADYADLDSSMIRCSKHSSTEYCLHLWSLKSEVNLIANFWDALEMMDRFDTIDDTLHYLYQDYDERLSPNESNPCCLPNNFLASHFDSAIRPMALTVGDVENLNNGEPLLFYDALVLYVDENLEFVDTMVQELEGKYNLKLCLKNRDLLAGLPESNAMLQLIEERRCARVVVVLSHAFLMSTANTFLTSFAHALSIVCGDLTG